MESYIKLERDVVVNYLVSKLPQSNLIINKKTGKKYALLYNRLQYLISFVGYDTLPCQYENSLVIKTWDEYLETIIHQTIINGVAFENNSLEKAIENEMHKAWDDLEKAKSMKLQQPE